MEDSDASSLLKEDARESDDRTVSFRSVDKMCSSLQDFLLGYLSLHMCGDREAWRVLGVLCWLESSLYSMDERNEEWTSDVGGERAREWNVVRRELRSMGAIEACEQWMMEGARYWKKEREWREGREGKWSAEDVKQMQEWKSFDYRMMHSVATRALGATQPSKELLECLRHYELMVETRDDCMDFEEDQEKGGAFNALAAWRRALGDRDGRQHLLQMIQKTQKAYEEKLAKLPQHQREAHTAYVKNNKGGAWLWDHIIPDPIPPPRKDVKKTQPSAVPLLESASLFCLRECRLAAFLLHHTSIVAGPLLQTPSVLFNLRTPLRVALIAVSASRMSRYPLDIPATLKMLLRDGATYKTALTQLPDTMSLDEVWRLCRLRAYDTLMVTEAICSANMVTLSDALRALILTLDMCVCLRVDLQEYHATVVRDTEGRAANSSVRNDPNQLNAAVLILSNVKGVNVEKEIRAQVLSLMQEAQVLLKELPEKYAALYAAQEKALIGDVNEWTQPPNPRVGGFGADRNKASTAPRVDFMGPSRPITTMI